MLSDLLGRVRDDEEFALDVIDYVLHHEADFRAHYDLVGDGPRELREILHRGGSVWEVTDDPEGGGWGLTRRAVGPVREAIQELPSDTRAHMHLVRAWNRLTGRDPDESGGYREAVRAVEAAAKPVVLPNNDRATLGQMIAAISDKPGKWSTTMGSVEDVHRMMEIVWTSQLDRHGTDDESIPLDVSPEQSDAAFAICLTLVRLFVGGHVRAT